MYLIWFDCCALAVSAIILMNVFTRNNIPIAQNRIFTYQVWTAFITTTCNLVLGIWQNEAFVTRNIRCLMLGGDVAFLYHILRMFNAFLFVYYIVIVLDLRERYRVMFFGVYLPFLLSMVVCVLGFIQKSLFYFDSRGLHHPGPLMNILYLIALYDLFVIIYLTVYYRKIISLPRRIAFYSFGTLVLGTVLIERIYPTVMVEGFGSVLCQLLIYLTIQRPDEVIDGVTGLQNRLSFMRMLSVQFRQKNHFDMVIVTVDNLRFLQRTLGLRAWGELMRLVAGFLRRLPGKVRAYQLSNGVFCLMVSGRTSSDQADILKGLIESRVSDSWKLAGGINIQIPLRTCLCHCPHDASTLETVMDLIEGSLPWSGETGELLNETRIRVGEVEGAIKRALEAGTFQVFYQPIYSVSRDCFISAEALLRLCDVQLGVIGPDEFIPVAEKNGMIVELGRYVLDKTCVFIKENRLIEQGIEYMEVNLSMVECLQEDLVVHILDTLKRHEVDTRWINLEITETARESLPEIIHENIGRLSACGIRFSLDDYGSGYSNIERILTTPLHIIKLDKKFLQTYFSSRSEAADIVLRDTVSMLKKLGKSIIAEGAETKEQADCLIDIGCDFIQGYYYSKPLSEQEFLEFFAVRSGNHAVSEEK